jgi:hypothetical protein
VPVPVHVPVPVVVVTSRMGITVRHRLLKPPARTQTPPAGFGGAHGRPGYRRGLCATTGGVPERARVRHGMACGEQVCRCHQKLVFLARQSNHALSLSNLGSSRSETSRLADYATIELSASHALMLGGRMQRRRDKVPEWLLLHVSPWLIMLHRILVLCWWHLHTSVSATLGLLANCNRQQSRVEVA